MASPTMANQTVASPNLPPLPEYTLRPRPDMLPFISDVMLSIILPTLVYWVTSLVFHIIDVLDLFPQYRLHTPEEITLRNRATRFEVFRDVVLEQVMQAAIMIVHSYFDPPELCGKEDYDVAVWATRIRVAQRSLPTVLSLLGINALSWSKSLAASHPILAGVLAGGHYPLTNGSSGEAIAKVVPSFASWELSVAKFLYYLAVPGLQITVATVIIDTWQYFLHRAMHMNKWLYTTFHSRHHRLYVPYAYGALYNHPFEAFIMDSVGAGLAYKLTGMTPRLGMIFFSLSIIKTIDDHCGYDFPWDPIQMVSSNNAAYHDIHHQHWGIKTNFSQPYFIMWDRLLGTMYKGDKAQKIRAEARAANLKRVQLQKEHKITEHIGAPVEAKKEL